MGEVEAIRENKRNKERIDSLEAKIKQLELATCALLEAFISVEDETGESYMPSGEYYGRKFD